MKHSSYPSLPALLLMLGTLTLVGCGGAFSMPDSVLSSQGAAPPVAVSLYGGHAPIVGAHVYLLQPSITSYGGQATSILGSGTATTPGGYPLHTNPATGGDPNIPANWQYVVSDNNGQVNFTGAYVCQANQPVYVYSYGGNATGGTATNTGIVELAILGNCPESLTPATGNFSTGSTALQFIYANEVSTAAAAYVFQPFTTVATTAATSSAIFVGSSGTTQALLGMQNAALTAAQLYDIQGGGGQSTANDGEGHVANDRTQGVSFVGGVPVLKPNIGNGVVPQATIDTLGNILADCVDSTGGTTTQCTMLFNNTTETGDSAGTKPTDIARAAMNLARYPAGNNSTANTPSNLTNIYALGNGDVPYLPRLNNQPNDFTIAINYPYTEVGGYTTSNLDVQRAESMQIDQSGEIWITAQGGGNGSTDQAPSADRWSPLGVTNAPNSSTYIFGYVSVDGSNNAWTGNADTTSGIFEASGNGVFTTTYGSGYNSAYVVVADNGGDVYFFTKDANTGTNFEMLEYPAGSTTTTTPTIHSISPSVITAGDNVAHAAIDASGDFWLTTEVENTTTRKITTDHSQIARVTATGAAAFAPITVEQQPEVPAIDHSGNAWIPIQAATGEIYKVSPTGGTTILTSASTGANLTWTFGSAIDGNGNVWVTNRCGNYGTCGGGTGINSIIQINAANNQAISPPTNYIPETQYPAAATSFSTMLDDSLNLAVDPSGNLWVTNYIGNAVVELVGVAAPAITPLSVSAHNGTLGTKP